MSRLDDLPPDQRATLSLLLRGDKTYAEVAALLSIQERAVHDRAHAALAVLAVRRARALSAERREEIGDYLLGQRAGVAEGLATRTYLQSTPEARAWAAALADELAPLAGDSPAQIPSGAGAPGGPDDRPPATAVPAPLRASDPAPKRSPRSSRTGGAVLLGALVAAVIVAVVLIADSGGSSGHQTSSAAAEASTASTASSTTAAGANGAKAKEDKRITLKPPSPSSSAAGIAEVLSEGKQYAFYLAAEHLPQSKGKGFFYAVWLYNSPSSHEALGRSPEVGANGSLQGGALLPADAGRYHTMLLTRETSTRPTRPGPIVLRGSFALH
jgi:hypothetical protein